MKKLFMYFMVLLLIFSVVGCSKAEPTPSASITVSAAASLRDALNEIQPAFEKETGTKVAFNFAASGTLQKQIEEGAPCDVFISAAAKQMDALESKDLVEKDSRINLLKNRLVLIVSKEYENKISSVSDLSSQDVKIAVGEPESVPAGQYAKDALTFLGLWDTLNSKMVFGKDVSQVATYVETGEAAAGLVYSSDASVLSSSIIKQTFEENTHKPIVYPAAVVASSQSKDAAKAFLEYLTRKESIEIFEKYGFEFYGK